MSDNRDVLDDLTQDARRLRVAIKLPDRGTPLTFEHYKSVVLEFEKFLQATQMSGAEVASRMGKGFSQATISQFRNSLNTEVWSRSQESCESRARAINLFMESYAQQQIAPKPNDWVETEVARRMTTVIKTALATKGIVTITSDSGRGKTMTMKACADIYTGSIFLSVMKSSANEGSFLKLLAAKLNCKAKTHSDREREVIESLTGRVQPLFVDEAQRLSSGALEIIRDLHDHCAIPIVLGGTRDLEAHADDHNLFYGQLASRIIARYDVNESVREGGGGPVRPIHTVDEIQKIFHNDQLKLTSDGAETLARLANVEGMGGLRLCRQVVIAAGLAVRGKDRPLDKTLILSVLRQLHGKTKVDRRIVRAMEEIRKVA